MRNRIFVIGLFMLLVGLVAGVMAQGRMQGQGVMHPAVQTGNQVIVTLTGTVAKVSMGAGQGMPSITINSGGSEFLVLLGPYRSLMNSKLEIKLGQAVEVKAFPDARISNAFVATEITVSGATLALRNAAGTPDPGGAAGMRQRGGMMGMGQGRAMGQGQGIGLGRGMMMRHNAQGAGACAYCADNLDLKAQIVLQGNVTSVNMAPGQGTPSFTLTSGSNEVTIIASPYHLLMQADFQISVGNQVSVTAYPVTNAAATYVAAAIQNLTTDKSLKLRDENGVPLGMKGNCALKGNCPCIK